MKDIYAQVGAKIRELRTLHGGQGISQEALAQAIRTTPNTISRWETATYRPSLRDLETLSRFFGVPITSFFPSINPELRLQGLLSATRDLDDDEFEELTRYALFRKARTALKAGTKRPRQK